MHSKLEPEVVIRDRKASLQHSRRPKRDRNTQTNYNIHVSFTEKKSYTYQKSRDLMSQSSRGGTALPGRASDTEGQERRGWPMKERAHGGAPVTLRSRLKESPGTVS